MENILKKPSTGGELLLKKKGKKYFKKLAIDGWATRREKKRLWELQQKKKLKSQKDLVVTGKTKPQKKS